MDYLKRIHPSGVVEPQYVYEASAPNVKEWFKDETLELTFGESTGRPSASFVMRKEYLTRFLENGWTVAAVVSSVESGEWKAVSGRASDQKSLQHQRGSDTSTDKRDGKNDTSRESRSSSAEVESADSSRTTDMASDGFSSSSSQTSSNGSSSETTESSRKSGTNSSSSKTSSDSSNSSSSSEKQNTSSGSSKVAESRSSDAQQTNDSTVTKHSGLTSGDTDSTTNVDETTESVAAYWAAYHRILLKRRRMVPELVMKTMLDTFTDAYNTGHGNDAKRYSELISLYSATISSTEEEMNALVKEGISLDGLYDKIRMSFDKSLRAVEESAKSLGEDGLAASLDEIRRRFDALIAKARSELISAGLYNGTIWITTEAGIERQRSAAIIAAKADASKAGVEANVAAVSAKNSAYAALSDIRKAMAEIVDKRRTTATEMRNAVVKWLADVVAARKDDAPQIEEFAQLVQTFGFSVGASGNVL